MASPTYQWNQISSTQTDSESPIDTALMEGIRQNLIHLREWLGSSFAPAVDHDHDGINSKSVLLADGVVVTAKLANASVTADKLKTARGSYSSSTGATHYISINRYSHLPSAQKTGTLTNLQLLLQSRNGQSWAASETTEVTAILEAGSSETFQIYWDYHIN